MIYCVVSPGLPSPRRSRYALVRLPLAAWLLLFVRLPLAAWLLLLVRLPLAAWLLLLVRLPLAAWLLPLVRRITSPTRSVVQRS